MFLVLLTDVLLVDARLVAKREEIPRTGHIVVAIVLTVVVVDTRCVLLC